MDIIAGVKALLTTIEQQEKRISELQTKNNLLDIQKEELQGKLRLAEAALKEKK